MASKIQTTTTILITTNKNQQLRLHHKLSLFLNHPLQKVFLKLKHLNEKKLTGVEKFKKVAYMIYLFTSCNTEERTAQNINIHNSNRTYKRIHYINNNNNNTTILIKKRIGNKNYKMQCPGLEFRLNLKLISWAGLKPKNVKNYYKLI